MVLLAIVDDGLRDPVIVVCCAHLVRVAKIASVIIALFSFAVAPMLYFAEEGLWQVVRVFTGFYNIPTVVIVIMGLFTTRVPALGAKLVIIFHVTAYGLLRFVFDDVVTLHFIHQYAILFVIEVGIMLAVGYLQPREMPYQPTNRHEVDMTPWRFARPTAFTLLSGVVALYLIFSPIGLASTAGISTLFALLMGALIAANLAAWVIAMRRPVLS